METDERTTAFETELRDLVARQRITDLYARYARGLDRNDPELVSGVFWPDAQLNFGAKSFAVDEFVEWDLDIQTRQLTSYAHHISNHTIEIEGDVAHSEAYVIGFFVPREERDEAGAPAWQPTLVAGRYIDRIDRRDGEWRVAVREFKGTFTARTEGMALGGDTAPHATWDRGDVSYRRPLERRPAGG